MLKVAVTKYDDEKRISPYFSQFPSPQNAYSQKQVLDKYLNYLHTQRNKKHITQTTCNPVCSNTLHVTTYNQRCTKKIKVRGYFHNDIY